MWTDAPKWPEFSLWKDKKKSTKALRFIQSHGDRGHVSKQGCALALSESIWAAKHHKDKLFMGSLAEVLEFNAHQLTITVPNTEWWLGTLNAEQVKSTIYIYLYKKKRKRVGCRSISDKVNFYSCAVSSLHVFIHLIDEDDSLFSESERCLLVVFYSSETIIPYNHETVLVKLQST